MRKLFFAILVFTLLFTLSSREVLAQEINETEPLMNVSCYGDLCTYFWGEILDKPWIPPFVVVSGFGDCSLVHKETTSLTNDSYVLTCEFPFLNLTMYQELILLLINDMNIKIENQNSEINVWKDNVTATTISLAESNGLIFILEVIIIIMAIVIIYMIYDNYW